VDTYKGCDYDDRRPSNFQEDVAVQAVEPEVMLPQYQESIVINAPVGTVFAAMTDIKRWTDWWPQVQDVILPNGWTLNGAISCRVMGIDLNGSVTFYDPDIELGFETVIPFGGHLLQHFTFHPEKNATRLTAELNATGMAGMVFTKKRLAKEMDQLKVNLESAEIK